MVTDKTIIQEHMFVKKKVEQEFMKKVNIKYVRLT